MLAYLQDFEAEPLIESLAQAGEVDLHALTRERFEARVGRLEIRVVNAKKPHGPWRPDLHDLVVASRRSYWETWGKIPLEDDLDEYAYVDVAWVRYDEPGHRNGSNGQHHPVEEGLTVRTVYIDREGTAENHNLPDDLRFWIGPGGVPLLDLMAQRLYGGDRDLARSKLVVGSRLASFRPPGRRHNQYTPEAYAALQIVAAWRAIQDGADYFINTMREEMTASVLSLPDGYHYEHFRTENRVGLPLGAIRLNRADPFVFDHMCHYPGYFTDTADFLDLIRRLLERGIAGFDADLLRDLGVDPTRLGSMKAAHLKVFSSLLAKSGAIGGRLTTQQLREMVRREVGDGPRSFTTPVRDRLAMGINLLRHSPESRRNGVR